MVKDIPIFMLEVYADCIKNKTTTLKIVAAALDISTRGLQKKFEKIGIKFDKGRPPNILSKEEEGILIDDVRDIYNNYEVGITKTHMMLILRHKHWSKDQVELALNKIRPILRKEKKVTRNRTRYECDCVNGIWHGDIHVLKCYPEPGKVEIKYLFALIDDKSRFIVNYGMFNNKTMKAVIKVFDKIEEKPLVYWSDNGGENTGGETKEYLKEFGITPVLTLPYNPEQNGKIEKFWQGLEKRIYDRTSWKAIQGYVDDYIWKYNYDIPHSALGYKSPSVYYRPFEIYFDEKYAKKTLEDTHIVLDNKDAIPLAEFLKHKFSVKEKVINK